MGETLYAISSEGGEVTFNTSGETVDREALYDAVSREIDVLALHECLDYFALSAGVSIGGGAVYRNGEWHVSIDDYFKQECGYDNE